MNINYLIVALLTLIVFSIMGFMTKMLLRTPKEREALRRVARSKEDDDSKIKELWYMFWAIFK